MGLKSFITGLSSLSLNAHEENFLKTHRPCGIILFDRNIQTKDQIKTLISDAKGKIGSEQLLVLIDQEGGRVARLRPPLFEELPPAQYYGDLYDQNPDQALEVIFHAGQIMAQKLLDFGINVNCIPVLDLPQPGAHEIIGNRAYGRKIDKIVALAGAFAKGHMKGGVLPVIKHIPGHGRAMVDSHLDLPVVKTSLAELDNTDFEPFRRSIEFPMAMTAHVQYADIDPDNPLTLSKIGIDQVIREKIGYQGLVMSDDLSMKALGGEMSSRAERAVKAGVDLLLHCNGDMNEMTAVAGQAPDLTGKQEQFYQDMFGFIKSPQPSGYKSVAALLEQFVGGGAVS